MYTPRPVVDRLIQDHQHTLLAEADAHRLAHAGHARRRPLESLRRRGALTAATGPTRVSLPAPIAPDLASVLADVGAAVDAVLSGGRPTSEVRQMAILVRRVADALHDLGAAVGLPPIDHDDPLSVVLRWLGRLSERSVASGPALDAERLGDITFLVSELRSLATQTDMARVLDLVASPTRVLSADLSSQPVCSPAAC